MFERFRRSRGGDTSTGSVATREREGMTGTETERGLDVRSDRADATRFERRSPGERDRGVEAGGGEADLAADRALEHDEMARGETAASDTALDRDHASDDLARDDTAAADTEPSPGERDRGVSTAGATGAAAAAGAAGAAAAHHHDHEAERDAIARQDAARDDTAPEDATRADAPAARERTLLHDRDARGTGAAAPDRDLDRPAARDVDRDGVDDRLERRGPVLAPAALDTMRARQRDRFGGFQWGSDFFGWLCAIGLASLLTAGLVGAGVALGLSTDDAANADTAEQIGLGGGIALLAVLAIAWFSGGYVAGRMARFDGARQGVGVWLWTLLAAVVVALIAAIGGSEYDVFQRLNLPRIAVGDTTLNAGGAIAGAAAVVVTLLFAVIGGKVGERFHRRVDRVATDEYVVER